MIRCRFFHIRLLIVYVNHVSLLYGEITAKNRLMQMTMLDLWVADDISLSTIKDGYNQLRNLGLAVLELSTRLNLRNAAI